MASTVNDIAAITADSQRETTGIIMNGFLRPQRGEIMRARVFIDNASDFAIDSPIVDTLVASGQRIFVTGVQYAMDIAHVLNFISKIGAGSNKSIGKFKLNPNAGITVSVGNSIFTATDQSGVLLLNCSTASTTNPLELTLHYQIADAYHIPVGSSY